MNQITKNYIKRKLEKKVGQYAGKTIERERG
jgi:hypothetical protein